MNNQEAIKNLEKLKEYFNSPMFQNSESMIDTMDIAIRSLQRKEELAETEDLAKEEEYRETPFDRVDINHIYYHITALGGIASTVEHTDYYDDELFSNCNYFNDEDFAKQVALHQLLYRKLLKFKLEREQETIISSMPSFISLDKMNVPFVDETCRANRSCNGVYFNERSIAKLALKEVVEPFLEEHPDFIWHL